MRFPTSLTRKSALLGSGLVGVLLAAAGIALSADDAPPLVGATSTASGAFSISGTTETMQPGVTTHLTLTVSNPQTTPLFLKSVSASVDSATQPGGGPAPGACAGYLDPSLPHTWTTWSGPTTVPAATDGSHPGTISIVVALSFSDSNTNQDACQGVRFNFSFAGSAYYTDPTSTSLTTSPNPSNVGAPVALKATVSATYSGANPTGTVSFSTPSGPIAGPVPLAPVSGTDKSTASLTTSSLPPGTTEVTSTYNPSGAHDGDADFSGSSDTRSESVVAGCVTGPTSGATTVIGPGQTYKGDFKVKAGTSLWLNSGTITGNVTVEAGGQFTANGGTVGHDVNGEGSIALQGTTVVGHVDAGGGVSLGYGTSVGNDVHAHEGGPACLNGITVGGTIELKKTGVAASRVCGSTAGNDLHLAENGAPVQAGGSSTCAGNRVGDKLVIEKNTGPLTIDGNQATNNIEVHDNRGGGTLTNNGSARGNCKLEKNIPGISGSGNTVPATKDNSCNRTA